MREYPLQYASTDKNKKSHYNTVSMKCMLGNKKYLHHDLSANDIPFIEMILQ